MDGEPVKSCTVLAAMADGHEVATIEGLEQDGVLDPVQQGFMEEHGLQCGFCTPGMMLTGRALLDAQPRPHRGGDPRGHLRPDLPLHRLREHRQGDPLGGRAREAAEVTPRPRSPMAATEERAADRLRPHEPQGGSALHPRAGPYVDDVQLPGMLHGAVLRSPFAHARIVSIDTSAA